MTKWKSWGTKAAAGATALLLVLFVTDLFRIESESRWAFPLADREAGERIRQIVESDPAAKVMVESGQFFYLNVMVASQHPDSFVLSPKPDLAPEGNLFLLYRTPEITRELDAQSGIVRIGRFGEWSLYRTGTAAFVVLALPKPNLDPHRNHLLSDRPRNQVEMMCRQIEQHAAAEGPRCFHAGIESPSSGSRRPIAKTANRRSPWLHGVT